MSSVLALLSLSSGSGPRRRRRLSLADGMPLDPRRGPPRKEPCNATSGYLTQPLVSALVQTFKDGDNGEQLAERLHAEPGIELL
eukprot:2129364-Prymnesium_polylepis.1